VIFDVCSLLYTLNRSLHQDVENHYWLHTTISKSVSYPLYEWNNVGITDPLLPSTRFQ